MNEQISPSFRAKHRNKTAAGIGTEDGEGLFMQWLGENGYECTMAQGPHYPMKNQPRYRACDYCEKIMPVQEVPYPCPVCWETYCSRECLDNDANDHKQLCDTISENCGLQLFRSIGKEFSGEYKADASLA